MYWYPTHAPETKRMDGARDICGADEKQEGRRVWFPTHAPEKQEADPSTALRMTAWMGHGTFVEPMTSEKAGTRPAFFACC
jgi:hypothetical protein